VLLFCILNLLFALDHFRNQACLCGLVAGCSHIKIHSFRLAFETDFCYFFIFYKSVIICFSYNSHVTGPVQSYGLAGDIIIGLGTGLRFNLIKSTTTIVSLVSLSCTSISIE